MKKIICTATLLLFAVSTFAQQKPKPLATSAAPQQDKEAIKSMAGIYKVSFDFAETFSSDTGYKYHDRKREWGIEYVFLVEETEKKISLQHLLIVNDTMIVKHWRQDWVYENTELYGYYKDNQWIKTVLKPEQVKGQWTQKVYQVDDSPRYEASGTWLHADGKHFWEGTCDAPLPRREFTVRSDYNVMRRHSRMEINSDGWALIQDNEKILRQNGIDKTLCWEKGIEKFTKGAYNAQPAISWWNKNTAYWADVRTVWNAVYTQKTEIKITKKVDNKILYEQLFKMGDDYSKAGTYNSDEAKASIKKTIELYLAKI
ncbi:MAG: hypothetical protein IAF38_09510 [Bacteroidia bacterium]|nr:hypothetical protein [Bacteroidia bacterium]